MDISLKQRLLGGALLVAVAVVFLPMMFDGAAREKPVPLDMDIPPEPSYTFAPAPGAAKDRQAGLTPAATNMRSDADKRIALAKPSAERPESQSPAAGGSAPANAPGTRQARVKLPAGKNEAAGASASDAVPAEVAAVDPAAEAPPSISESTPLSSPPVSEPVAPDSAAVGEAASPQASAWAVQVGSFSEHDNAQTLRNQLRASGFSAFEQKVESGGEQVFRVKVGPELDRGRAEALQGKLQTQQDLRGIVVSHPRDAAPVVLRGGG